MIYETKLSCYIMWRLLPKRPKQNIILNSLRSVRAIEMKH